MDLERYFELRTILQRWRMTLAESIRRRVVASPRLARRVERIYAGEGAAQSHRARCAWMPSSIAWVHWSGLRR
jgi:hypothetical protein